MSYSTSFMKHLKDRHDGKAKEHVIIRQGLNAITGKEEIILMMPWRLEPQSTTGHIQAHVEVVGEGRDSQRTEYVDYDGVIKRTASKITPEGKDTDLYKEFTEESSEGDVEIRSKLDFDTYAGYARMAIDDMEWDGFEMCPRGKEKVLFTVVLTGKRETEVTETYTVEAHSEAAAVSLAKSGLVPVDMSAKKAVGDFVVESAEATLYDPAKAKAAAEALTGAEFPLEREIGDETEICSGCPEGWCEGCAPIDVSTEDSADLIGGPHPMGGIIEEDEAPAVSIEEPDTEDNAGSEVAETAGAAMRQKIDAEIKELPDAVAVIVNNDGGFNEIWAIGKDPEELYQHYADLVRRATAEVALEVPDPEDNAGSDVAEEAAPYPSAGEHHVIVVRKNRILESHPVQDVRPQEAYDDKVAETVLTGVEVILVVRRDDGSLEDHHSGRKVQINGVHFRYEDEANK